MICVGFAGCEAFDLIIYFSRTLVRLHYPVLIIDISDSGALKKAIYHGMDLDSSRDIINYRNIHYLRRCPAEAELHPYQEGFVIINYGFHSPQELPFICDHFYIVMNAYPHIIDKINELISDMQWRTEQLIPVIRDIILPGDIERVTSTVKLPLNTRQYCLYLDQKDYFCSISCQMQKSFRFVKLSSDMKKFIIDSVHNIIPQIKNKIIKKAFSMAGRGR